MNQQDIALQIDALKQRILGGEALSVEECQKITAYLRELRGKARPTPAGKKVDAGPTIPVADMLKGL